MINDLTKLEWSKNDGLIPVVVQDNATLQVLMLGYMNQEALAATLATQRVTFFSRSKQRLWVKGETSHNYLQLEDIFSDCDQDTLLVMATPAGATCHRGSVACFSEQALPALSHIGALDNLIQQRIATPSASSYTNQLLARGLNKVAQKVGEEAVEVVIAALAETNAEFLGEMTDLIYHLLVLLHAKGLTLDGIAAVIAQRHADKTTKIKRGKEFNPIKSIG